MLLHENLTNHLRVVDFWAKLMEIEWVCFWMFIKLIENNGEQFIFGSRMGTSILGTPLVWVLSTSFGVYGWGEGTA